MAGKKSAKQVMDEWQAKLEAQAAIAGEGAADAGSVVGQVAKVAGNAALAVDNPVRAALGSVSAKRFAQGAGIVDKDVGYYGDQAAQAAGSMMPSAEQLQAMKQQAMQLGQQGASAGKGLLSGASDAYNSLKADASAGKLVGLQNLNSPYDIEMQGMDMQSTPETQAYWQNLQNQVQKPMGERVMDAGKGSLPGDQQAAPDAAQGLIDNGEVELRRMWDAMDPIQKEMFLQQMQARQQGGTP